MAEGNSRPAVLLSIGAAQTSHNHCPHSTAIQVDGVVFDRAVVPIGNCQCRVGALTRLYYYRTNYGKITSFRDRLFQINQIRPDFRLL